MSPTSKDPLACLEVLDRLEVGPVRLAPKELTATYTLHIGDRRETQDFAYRYEEAVFDPESAADQNLAAVAAAQVALNYGLFAKEIVLHGDFDGFDRRFLAQMLENTAREIFVKKLLQPNPFLVGEAAELPAVKLPRYARAELRFEGKRLKTAPADGWQSDPDRYCVLSSGGKDSLASFGLLEELGKEPEPIFVNESGRHWFTALKAYRWLDENVPATGRVWTNSDRLFTWMLRHLPFVRQDFARQRADIYPIRLWTVAIFVFGVLPLLKRRGIGRLIIGDEHDTTVRLRHEGIPHYDGLFDQSLYFDHALSRYYRRKGWGLTQGSLLRPLSELLIEKLLVDRYPHLLALQVSCHAAHIEEEDVRPCGKCEKCRRIVGMLLALGADPQVCGYPPEVQQKALKALAEHGDHQEKGAAEQVAWLLRERGLLEEGRLGETEGAPRPEILGLRFHPERSPVHEIPRELRRPLYELLLETADGAVRREERKWVPFDLLNSGEMDAPYPFDRPSGPANASLSVAAGEEAGYLWGELSWPQAKGKLQEVDIALLPVGAIEQHGHHLPLDVDSFDADYLARRVAEACSDPKPLVLPLIPYGVSYHHDAFPGTVSVSNEALSRFVYDIGMSLARHGVSKLVIVNGHGGNIPTLHFAAQMINRDARIFTCVESGETSDAEIDALTDAHNDVHAGDIETSTTLAVRPHLVRMEDAVRCDAPFSSHFLDFTSQTPVGWYAHTDHLSTSGVLGDATAASKEKGERAWKIMIERLTEFVEHLKGLSLDEIYQRRY